MSSESLFGTKHTQSARTEDPSAHDGSSRISTVLTSLPGQRPMPEGLLILADDITETALSDTSWQDKPETALQGILHLVAELDGENCGGLFGSFVVKKNPDTGMLITDRYVQLGNVEVRDTAREGNVRQRGIGSALLVRMEDYARRFGASRIEGTILPSDLVDNPHLPNFYRNREYHVAPRGEGFTLVKQLK